MWTSAFHSAYFVLVLLALGFCVAHMLKPDRIPLWIATLFLAVAALLEAYPKT